MLNYKRILCVSDIHGECDRFRKLLTIAEYNSNKDLLIVLGDIVDRGVQNITSLELCEYLRRRGAVLIKGNHEEFLQKCVDEMLVSSDYPEKLSPYFLNWITSWGGENTFMELKNLSQNQLRYILNLVRSMILFFVFNEFVFVHAGVDASKPLEENTIKDLLWGTDDFCFRPAYSGKTVIFGHTPTWGLLGYGFEVDRREAAIWYDQRNKDKIGIDCGNTYGGRLACLELPSMKEFYVS